MDIISVLTIGEKMHILFFCPIGNYAHTMALPIFDLHKIIVKKKSTAPNWSRNKKEEAMTVLLKSL